MTEETLLKIEKKMDNNAIASKLRKIADKIERKEKIRLQSNSDSVELDTDREAVFEIKVERESGEESLEIEIEWKTNSDSLQIE